MKMPIPSDWDGQSTCDYRVTWPDSTIWRFILRGLLTNPAVSDFWDASTGDVEQILSNFQPIMISALDNLECGAMQIPIGTIFEFAGSTLPEKFLWCDGSAVPIADYLELYQTIGDTFHPGGIGIPENFYLPDKRGRVGVGKNPGEYEFSSLGQKGGLKVHTLTINEIPSHNHNFNYRNSSGVAGNPYYPGVVQGYTTATSYSNAALSHAGGGQAHNNLSPYLVLNYIIKAK